MQLKWIATAALAVAVIPAAAMAQSKTAKDSAKASSSATRDSTSQRSSTGDTVSSTSTGEVSSPGGNVTDAMLKAREDPNLIGSPAWWKNHATADGKPISGQRSKSP